MTGIVCADEPAGGPSLKDLIPILEQEGEAAYLAAETIGHLGAAAAEARPALEKACSSKNPRLRVAAAVALIDMHGDKERLPEIAIRTLVDLLGSKQPEIRREAIRGLSHAKKINPNDLRAIALALVDEDELVALHAADTLVEMGEAAAPLLADAIANDRTAMWGMVALGRLGSKGKGGQSALIKRLADKDPILRQEAALTLSQIGPDSSIAVEALLPLLDDPVRSVQLAAAFSVSSLGPEGKRATGRLEQMLSSDDHLSRLVGARGLATLGEVRPGIAEKIVEILTSGLSDSRPMVRRESAIALGELGPLAASARPTLVKLGEDKDESIAQAAKMAVDRIEKGNK
jgi:HEAT repeat protein